MKHVSMILVLLLFVCSLSVAQLPQPKSFYDFEEGEGIDVTDQGSAANHGKLFGDEIDWATGGIINKVGDPDGCIEIMGDDVFAGLSFVEIPYAEFHDAPNYTFAAWVQWLAPDPNWGYVFWQGGDIWPEEELVRHVDLWWHASGQNMAAVLHDENNTAYALTPTIDETGLNIHDGDWHLVAITLEENSIFKIWTDGVVIAEDTTELPVITNGMHNLWLGARPNDAELNTCVKMIGLMDRVRIWDEALTEEQMLYLLDLEGPDGGSVGVAENISTPAEFALHANYPNPFNPTTTIAYSIDRAQNATVIVYDLLGHKIKTLTTGVQTAGEHHVQWNGTNDFGQPVSSGVYIYQLKTTDRVETRKMMLLK